MVKHFWQSVDSILEDVSVTEKKIMRAYKFKDYRLSVLQELRYSDTCNQIKCCTKHDRPNQS